MEARKLTGGVLMPPGEYFVGDPCYFVPDARWDEWLVAADYIEVLNGPEPHYLLAELDGHSILGIGTAYGDGLYRGTDGHNYGVDAGLLGLVPVSIGVVSTDEKERITFEHETRCWYEDGKIHLGDLVIDTDPPEEVWEDEHEDDEEPEDEDDFWADEDDEDDSLVLA